MSDNLNNINENVNTNDTANTSEAAPLIIDKDTPQDNNHSINYLYPPPNPVPPEESYVNLTVKEDDKLNQVYRWSMNDEVNYKNKRKTKKAKKGIALKIFAAIMSVMFLFSATFTAYIIIDNINAQNNPENNDISSNSSTPVLSNQDAVNESQNILNNSPNDSGDSLGAVEDVVITIPEITGSKILSTEDAIAKVKPSVVCIETESEVAGYGRYFGGRGNNSYNVQGVGTGFIVSDDGYIATNYHVVEGAHKITVTLSSGETYAAELIGGDEVADLAIIKINAKNLPVVELGDSDALNQGQDVVAIGTPAGIEFAGTATKGIVSAINRDVDVNGQKIMTVIQTDASINPGNSGGPLINMKGQVIGINSMKLASTQYEGMGFAIPINIAIPVFNDIIANPGVREAPAYYNSEDLSTVSFDIKGYTVYDEETGIPQGWKIAEIYEDGACYNTGIQLSDIIIAVDGVTVSTTEDLLEIKMNYNPGDEATVRILRNGDIYEFVITFAAR